MAEAPIAGAASIFANGQSFALRGEFTVQLTVPKRETIVGLDSVHGFKQSPGIGQIKAKFTNTPDLDIVSLSGTGIRVIADLKNGKTVTGDGLWTTEPPSVNVDEGTVEFTWEGRDVAEQTA